MKSAHQRLLTRSLSIGKISLPKPWQDLTSRVPSHSDSPVKENASNAFSSPLGKTGAHHTATPKSGSASSPLITAHSPKPPSSASHPSPSPFITKSNTNNINNNNNSGTSNTGNAAKSGSVTPLKDSPNRGWVGATNKSNKRWEDLYQEQMQQFLQIKTRVDHDKHQRETFENSPFCRFLPLDFSNRSHLLTLIFGHVLNGLSDSHLVSMCNKLALVCTQWREVTVTFLHSAVFKSIFYDRPFTFEKVVRDKSAIRIEPLPIAEFEIQANQDELFLMINDLCGSNAEKEDVQAFLRTFPAFTTTTDILNRIAFLLNGSPENLVLQGHVSHFLCQWASLPNSSLDREEFIELFIFVKAFIFKDQFWSQRLLSLIVPRATAKITTNKNTPTPLSPKSVFSPTVPHTIASVPAEDFARTLTFDEFKMFAKIPRLEFLHHSKESPAPHIGPCFDRWYQLSRWIRTVILRQDEKAMPKIIQKFIETAQQLFQLSNFQTLSCFVYALSHDSIASLDRIWKKVPAPKRKVLDDLALLYEDQDHYQKTVKAISTPLIPCFHFVLMDLQNLVSPRDHLSLKSQKNISKIFERLEMWQGASFDLRSRRVFIEEVTCLPDEELEALSLIIKNKDISKRDILLPFKKLRKTFSFEFDKISKTLEDEKGFDVKNVPVTIDFSEADIDVNELLGGGGSATKVHRATVNGFSFAAKIWNAEHLSPDDKLTIQREIKIMEHLKGDNNLAANIVPLLGVSITRKEICLFMELFMSDLKCLILKKRSSNAIFSEREMVGDLLQIARGLAYIHNKKVIHRDLKSENIFILASRRSRTGRVLKIGDFGEAKLLSQPTAYYTGTANFGTKEFCPPEAIANSKTAQYSQKADVWAFGMIAFELLTLDIPYRSEQISAFDLLDHIQKGKRPAFEEKLFENLKKNCAFVLGLHYKSTQANPEERISSAELAAVLEKQENLYI